MAEETITQIEDRIKKARIYKMTKERRNCSICFLVKDRRFLNSPRPMRGRPEYYGLPRSQFTRQCVGEKHPQLLRLSLRGLSTSAERLESSHPKLVGIVNSICNTLSNIGIWKNEAPRPCLPAGRRGIQSDLPWNQLRPHTGKQVYDWK